jgi:hypothetical protein
MFLKRIRDNDSPLVLDNSTFADDDDYMSDFDEPQDLDNSISAGGSVNL